MEQGKNSEMWAIEKGIWWRWTFSYAQETNYILQENKEEGESPISIIVWIKEFRKLNKSKNRLTTALSNRKKNNRKTI